MHNTIIYNIKIHKNKSNNRYTYVWYIIKIYQGKKYKFLICRMKDWTHGVLIICHINDWFISIIATIQIQRFSCVLQLMICTAKFYQRSIYIFLYTVTCMFNDVNAERFNFLS